MITEHNTISTIILADGKFPSHSFPLSVLEKASQVVCCDGATEKLLAWGREPDIIVGDMDSLSDELKIRYNDRIFHSDDQETNDLTKAVYWCIEHGIPETLILGATGLRDDHTLGNISLLVEYIPYIQVEMITDTGTFTPIVKNTTFNSKPGQQISIFTINPETEITTQGLKYEVTNRKFSNWWQGTLNESITNSFTVNLDNGKVVVFRQHV